MIVVTNPTPVNNEATIINAMFYDGLELLHIRKPDATVGEVRQLIESINPVYYPRLALHQHHEIASDYGIYRLHYTETERVKQPEKQLADLRQKGFILSTSVHSRESYVNLPLMFSYVFIGPVFNSISKKDYLAMKSADESWKKNGIDRIAIGGITAENCNDSLLNHFDDIAVLGALWLSEEPLHKFKLLRDTWSTTGQ